MRQIGDRQNANADEAAADAIITETVVKRGLYTHVSTVLPSPQTATHVCLVGVGGAEVLRQRNDYISRTAGVLVIHWRT